MDEEKLRQISTLLSCNQTMFMQMANGEYGDLNSDFNKGAVSSYLKNNKNIEKLVGILTLHKADALLDYSKQVEALENNKELVSNFFDTIKSDADNLEWHKTDRVYVLNKEEGKYDVIEEKLEAPERRIFSELEDDTYSKEEWQDSIKDFAPEWGHDKNIFDEDIISAAYAFMVGPVGIQRKKVIAAESRKYSSLEELKQDILTEAKEKDMVLYMTYAYQVADPRDINKYSFKVTENYPKITMYCWRGAFLDKE